jgi:hypothetical protein
LGAVKLRQIVQRARNIGMIRTKRFFIDRQRPFVQQFGFGIAPLLSVEKSKIVQRLRDIGVIRTKCFPRIASARL